MEKKRMKLFFFGVAGLLGILGFRLFSIQMVHGEELAAAAFRQQRTEITGMDRRGVIVDRNGVPLTGQGTEYLCLVPKQNADEGFRRAAERAGGERRGANSGDYAVYAFETYDAEFAARMTEQYGAYFIENGKRYSDSQPAAHVIGYINPYDDCGVSGIEKELDAMLVSNREKLYGITARDGTLLAGFPLIGGGKSGDEKIVLTIDARLQAIAEESLRTSAFNGAVLILESKTGEILALASAPEYNPNRVEKYLHSEQNELLNKCTQGEYPPGSVFKIIVAAAALENGITDSNGRPVDENTVFYCNGKETLSGIEIGCSTGGKNGHGRITLRDAFAYSCNCAFIQLGQRTGAEKILEMAEKFGLGTPPLSELPEVRSGNLPSVRDAAGDGIGNLSIGQGTLLATPLQIARLTNVIACGGTDTGMTLIRKSGEEEKGSEKAHTGIISKKSAEILTEMMKDTARYGTARGIDPVVHPAGKTGSAESSIGGNAIVHGWFTGFFPAEDPKWTVTVLMENGRSGRAAAVPVFEEIIRAMREESFLSFPLEPEDS